jgi:hypothetical protein
MADVVFHRVGAQMKLLPDLLRRAPLLEQPEHLDLTRREMWNLTRAHTGETRFLPWS